MKYYDRFRVLRLQLGKTQAEIAELLGTSAQYYQKYENGIRPLPIKHLIVLCRYFHVSADFVLGL